MKFLRIAAAVLVVVLLSALTTSCDGDRRPPKEVNFSCTLDGKLHIFSNDPGDIGLPSDANVYIIDGQPVVDQSVNLGQGVQSLEKLEFEIDYEYHADSTNSPATLEFVVEDARGNQVWRGNKNFLPSTTKERVTDNLEFTIGQEYDELKVLIRVKPLSAGDFGFYIYNLTGTITVR